MINIFIPDFMRKRLEEAIEEATHPKGMSTHSGRVTIQVADLVRLIKIVDSIPDLLKTNLRQEDS